MKVAPSILSVLNDDLLNKIKLLEKANATYIHLDVMDNVFVPNYTFDEKLVKTIKENTSLIVDTHLMIQEPLDKIDDYIKTSSDYLCFHIEATKNPKLLIEKIKKANLKVGISIKPKTPIEAIKPLLEDLDLVLVMSVEPGFGGQKLMMEVLPKVEELFKLRHLNNYHYLLEIDGGINKDTAVLAKKAGCDIIVVGTYLFNSDNIENTIKELEQI